LANATDREIVDEVSFAILCEFSSVVASFPSDISLEDSTEKKRGRSGGRWRKAPPSHPPNPQPLSTRDRLDI